MNRTFLQSKLTATVAAGILFSGPLYAAPEGATGTVFEDLNGNGTWDGSEPTLSGVLVSNGRDVVQTDGEGKWSLPVLDQEPFTFFSVVKPTGYEVPVDKNNLPQFYYLHQPDGSPSGLRFAGIEPTGELPESINFALMPAEESDKFKAIMIADPQPMSDKEVTYVRDDFVSQVIGTEAVMGITHGDIMFDDMSLFPRYNAIIGKARIPWYNVPGNHEINFLAESDTYATETFKRYFGPTYYAHEYGQVLFITLDSTYYEGTNPDDVRGRGSYRGHIPEQQLVWLKNLVQYFPKDKLVVISTHIPYTDPFDDSPGVNTDNRQNLFEIICGKFDNVVSFSGHTHENYHVYYDGQGACANTNNGEGWHENVLTTVSGAWWSGPFDERGIPTSVQRDGTPNGWHELVVNGNQYESNYVPMEKQAELQMRIMCDTGFHGIDEDGSRDYNLGEIFNCRITKDQVLATDLHVDFFDGGPKSTVKFEVAGQTVEMTRTPYVDIHVQQLYQRADDKKSWVNGETSDHIWVADLPAYAITPGLHSIKVTATDEYGREHLGYRTLEVASFSNSEATSSAKNLGATAASETDASPDTCTLEQLEHIKKYGCDPEENLCGAYSQQL
jgi:hypothetical protein